MRYVALVYFLLFSLTFSAQISVQGVVKDKGTNKAVQNAVVTLSAENDIVGYDITNENGEFFLKAETNISSLTINISLLGYTPQTIQFQNKKERLQIYLQPAEIQLKEIKISSNAIWQKEDTLVYSVRAFQSAQDRKIGDILKKLPGIQVSENGAIQYNGVPINKFYIDGSDLLESKYGIATNNVPVDAITNIEVIQNHQPVKVLKDVVVSDQAAINLKVKNNRMSQPVGEAKLGGGYSENDFLYDVNALAMQIQKKNQMLVMYKTNNTGVDIASELTNHTLITAENNIRKPLNSSILSGIEGLSAPPLEEERYLFNKTHLLTINNLWKLNDDKQLRVNINYLNNKINRTLYQNSSYVLLDSTIFIPEIEKYSKRNDLLDGILTYTNNSKENYINNQTKVSAEWNKTASDIYTEAYIREHYKTPLYYIHNDLNVTKKIRGRIFNISSYIQYSSLPHHLYVEIDTLDNKSDQKINHRGFYTQNSTSLTFLKRNSSFKIDFCVEGSLENLKSDLDHYYRLPKDSLQNNIHFDYIKFQVTPSYTLQMRKSRLSIETPVNQRLLSVKDTYSGKDKNYNIYIDPQIRYKYIMNVYWEANLSYRYTHDIGDITDFIHSFIMTNYRTIIQKSGILAKRNGQSVNLRINYKNPVSTLFANTNIYYRTSKINTLNQQDFSSTQAAISDVAFDNSSHIWIWNGYIGKYVDAIKTNFSISTSYSNINSKKRQQSVLYSISSTMWNVNTKINTKINDHVVVEYKADLVKDILSVKNDISPIKTSVYRINQKLSSCYLVNKEIELFIDLEHLHNKITDDLTSNIFFANTGFKYKHKQFEYSLSCNNIFNKKDYSYTIYNTLNTYNYLYKIRPINVLGSICFRF
ncbi:MAG: TonB-dependent receptor [Prevotella sp.]|jgi:hypothetical protein|nr:TonB-dependent receptor [Prevotella sp.]